MRIAIGNDHIAVDMKEHVKRFVVEMGHEVVDFGTDTPIRVVYPVYAKRVADAVASGDCALGILICGTGVGMAIAANKVRGIRAAVCSEPYSARLTRMHNNANIITFGARVIARTELARMLTAIVNVLSPDVLLISGGMSLQRELYIDPIMDFVREHSCSSPGLSYLPRPKS